MKKQVSGKEAKRAGKGQKKALREKKYNPPGVGGYIRYPWLVVHQSEPNGEMITVLSGPNGAGLKEFSLVLADSIQHVARAFDVSLNEVLLLVEQELNNPTTDVKGGKVN